MMAGHRALRWGWTIGGPSSGRSVWGRSPATDGEVSTVRTLLAVQPVTWRPSLKRHPAEGGGTWSAVRSVAMATSGRPARASPKILLTTTASASSMTKAGRRSSELLA